MSIIKSFFDKLEKLKEDPKPKVIATEQKDLGAVLVEPEDEQPKTEEWVWVEGYKGTDKDMSCRGFQYEFGVQYDIPENEEVIECKNGFHLSLDLYDAFKYYYIGDGHRFFKVKALVRKKDRDRYSKICYDSFYHGYMINQLVAKSIVFISELTRDEILEGYVPEDMPDKYKDMAIELSPTVAMEKYQTESLVADGYSLAFATHVVSKGQFKVAHAVGSMSDLSMDMKVWYILSGGSNL